MPDKPKGLKARIHAKWMDGSIEAAIYLPLMLIAALALLAGLVWGAVWIGKGLFGPVEWSCSDVPTLAENVRDGKGSAEDQLVDQAWLSEAEQDCYENGKEPEYY